MFLSRWELGRAEVEGMKKRPDGRCRGRNSEYQFRRIYPTQSDMSSEKGAALRRRGHMAALGHLAATPAAASWVAILTGLAGSINIGRSLPTPTRTWSTGI